MPIEVSYNPAESGVNFPVCPEGLFQAVCVDVIDLGMVPRTFEGVTKMVHMVKLRWQTAERDEASGKRFQLSKRYALSLHPKATLRGDLESWRGRRFTDDELKKFDLEVIITMNCQIQVIHNPGSEGRIYANVDSIVRPNSKEIAIRPEDYVRQKDRPAKDNGTPRAASHRSDDDTPF